MHGKAVQFKEDQQMSNSTFGEISSDKTYHLNAILSILQLSDNRSGLRFLAEIQCKYVRLSNRQIFVSGLEINRAIQRFSTTDGQRDEEEGEQE